MTILKAAYNSLIRTVVAGFMLVWGILFYSILKREINTAIDYINTRLEGYLLEQITEPTNTKPIEWKSKNCSQCTRLFRYPVNEHYTPPKTCTEFECAFKEAHPELKR